MLKVFVAVFNNSEGIFFQVFSDQPDGSLDKDTSFQVWELE